MINYTVWITLKHCLIPLNIKRNLTGQNRMKTKACYTKKERTKFVIVSQRASCLRHSLAILRPPKLQKHSLFHSDSSSLSTNSAVLSVFLKSKNPSHWVLFPSAYPPPIYHQENPHLKHQAVGSKASIPINSIKRKKIKNFNCPCIHSLQSENVFQFFYRLVFSLLFSLCINYDQVLIIWLDSFFI